MAPFALECMPVLDQASERPSAALIFLHGANDTGEICKNIFLDYLKGKGHPYFKIYFPTAPERYLVIRDKRERCWFDVLRTGSECSDVKCSIKDAEMVSDTIENIIEDIVASGIRRERIAIGGFSQGGMVSIYAAYVRKIKVAGVVGAASIFPFHRQSILQHGNKTKLLSLYGSDDSFITRSAMDTFRNSFKSKGIPIENWTSDDLGHVFCVGYLDPMFKWLEIEIPPII